MSKRRQRLWLISLILLYLILAAVGFGVAYFIKTEFFPNQPVLSQTTQTKKIPTIPTGWKLYTNADVHIQFAYPASDSMKTKSYGFGVSSLTLQTTNGNSDFQILLLPKSLAQAIGQNFDEYYTLPNNTTKTIKNPLAQNSTTERFTKIKNDKVNELSALDYQAVTSNAKPNTKPEIGTFIQAGDNLILISTSKNNKEKLNQLLKTFQYQN